MSNSLYHLPSLFFSFLYSIDHHLKSVFFFLFFVFPPPPVECKLQESRELACFLSPVSVTVPDTEQDGIFVEWIDACLKRKLCCKLENSSLMVKHCHYYLSLVNHKSWAWENLENVLEKGVRCYTIVGNPSRILQAGSRGLLREVLKKKYLTILQFYPWNVQSILRSTFTLVKNVIMGQTITSLNLRNHLIRGKYLPCRSSQNQYKDQMR